MGWWNLSIRQHWFDIFSPFIVSYHCSVSAGTRRTNKEKQIKTWAIIPIRVEKQHTTKHPGLSLSSEEWGSSRCKGRGWGGGCRGAEYVLIGGSVKQLGEHILARLWPISLEQWEQWGRQLSVITTSPSLRSRRKRMQPQKGIFLLWPHVPHYDSTPSLAQQWRGQLSYVSTFVQPGLFLFRPRSTQIALSSCATVSVHSLSAQWLALQNDKNKVRTHVLLKTLNAAHNRARTDKPTLCAN